MVVVFKFATGNVKEGIENRFKQLRALVTKQSWETSEETTNKVCAPVMMRAVLFNYGWILIVYYSMLYHRSW